MVASLAVLRDDRPDWFIDGVMDLPQRLAQQSWQDTVTYQKEKPMPFITTPGQSGFERGHVAGHQEGRQQDFQDGWQEGWREGWREGWQQGWPEGRQEGREETLRETIEWLLQSKFGADGLKLMPEIRQLGDVDVLRATFRAISTAATPDEMRRVWAPEGRP
jgi:hypothetical protein